MNIFGLNISVNRSSPRTKASSKNVRVSQPSGRASVTGIDPGRVSVPDDGGNFLHSLKGLQNMVSPSFRVEVIELIRKLYKVNPDISKALQDTFQLANTGHRIEFPNNTDEESDKMRDHLREVTANWSNYTNGIDGLVTRMIVQCMISGAISVEGVPNDDLSGLSTILFVKPENIVFKREANGVYQPYQRNLQWYNNGQEYIKLNTQTYRYVSMYNDTDEPYGIPPFMAALDSVKSQADMKINMKHIMENAGMLGFLEALIEKPVQTASESVDRYERRLNKNLHALKVRLKEGMKDGLIVGYKEDCEFKMNSTTKDMDNIDKPWTINQQSIANGLGINSSLIGVSTSTTEGGAGINLSTLLSQLKNIQNMVRFVLEFIYSLELRLAGFNNKGITITWYPATVSDDVKIQQANQYKVQNLHNMYTDGVISLTDYAQAMGYDQPDQDEPRVPLEQQSGNSPAAAEDNDKNTKNTSARRSRDKAKSQTKRKDQNSNPR